MASRIKYDVFISFRGTDVRYSFLSHLVKQLGENQVDAYVDDRLEGGDEISHALLKAIEESHISLVIFSKDYASSRWCLEELVKIIECMDRNKQIVIPVFYNIDPSDVRLQKGTYGDALAKHEKDKRNLDRVPNWRSALNKAANLSGFHSSNFRNEAELKEKIVKRLSSKLNLMYQNESTDLVGADKKPDHVGIEKRVADVKSLLHLGFPTDVRVIGIWGMGGIGKTTIAAAIYDCLCSEYDGCCFMANITEESKYHGMIYLKNKILSKLLKEDVQIDTSNGVPPYVKRRLVRKKVFLVLDDINDSEHLENLVGALDLFGSGSRIIVTTRDKQVLSNKVDNDNIYEAKALSSDEANKLFILNAFKKNGHDMEWIGLSRRVIQYCNGNPLALKVLGSFLCDKSKTEWESLLQKLKKMPHPKLQDVLRLSFDKLDREEKEIFLYIACFLKGYEFQQIIDLLDACGFSTIIGLKALQDKALIEAKDYGRSIAWMHDLLQEMGWQIVREESEDPGKRSRLWDPNDILQVLINNKGTETIKSIILNVSKLDELCLGPRVFARMQQLKFLIFTQSYGHHKPILCFPEGLESLPNGLLVFQWDSYPLKSLPQSFRAENLVELKMTKSRVEKLWDGIQNLQNLKNIDLSDSEYLLELPDFSKASNLKEVKLIACRNLRNVHPSILSLHKLVRLNLRFCEALTSLRSETHLRSLRDLHVGFCPRLKEFSVTSENMKHLDLTSTAINEIPSSIGSLQKLKILTLSHCSSLKYLPNKVAHLRSLQNLHISGCRQFYASNLHILINGLRSLVRLKMEKCPNLIEIPDNISLLSSLRDLSLRETNIKRIPASIKYLSKLEYFNIEDCLRLRYLPELPSSIKWLCANNCSSLETLMFTPRATELLLQATKMRIQFKNCGKLDEHSISAIGVSTHLNMKKLAYDNLSKIRNENVEVIYPGSKVPEWFEYRTTKASITVDMSSALPFKLIGFVFCVIVGPFEDVNFIGCERYLETGHGERRVIPAFAGAWSGIHTFDLFSDHVCMWYMGGKLRRDRVRNKVSFEFFFNTIKLGKEREDSRIKGCGVCPIYDTKSTLRSIATKKSVACSDKKVTLAAK